MQACHEVAAVYDRQGRPADARRLRVWAARQMTQRGPKRLWPIRGLSDAFNGYGYHTLRPAYYLAGAILASMLLVFFNLFAFIPANPNLATPPPNPWLYGAAIVLPAIAIPGLDRWVVTEWWIASWLLILKVVAWIQAALLLAGLTGLLKKS